MSWRYIPGGLALFRDISLNLWTPVIYGGGGDLHPASNTGTRRSANGDTRKAVGSLSLTTCLVMSYMLGWISVERRAALNGNLGHRSQATTPQWTYGSLRCVISPCWSTHTYRILVFLYLGMLIVCTQWTYGSPSLSVFSLLHILTATGPAEACRTLRKLQIIFHTQASTWLYELDHLEEPNNGHPSATHGTKQHLEGTTHPPSDPYLS